MNPLLLEIPTRIDTKRLYLRIPMAGEGETVHASIKASINELKLWLALFQSMPEINETEILVRRAHIQFLNRESFRFFIFSKETDEFIGTCSLHNINWDIPKFEIGYWIDTRFSGKGFMTEAIEVLTRFAIQELNSKRIEIRCESSNMKSRMIPEKLGFELEGILRNEDFSADGKKLTDTCIYAKIN